MKNMEKLPKTLSAQRASTVNVKYVRAMNPSVTGVMRTLRVSVSVHKSANGTRGFSK